MAPTLATTADSPGRQIGLCAERGSRSLGAVRILWLYGAPGTGKSTTAWATLNLLSDSGERAAHVDIDQLGMVYPAPAGDPYADNLKGEALRVTAETLADLGVETLVVSGVLYPESLAFYEEQLGAFPLALVRLVVAQDEQRRRIDQRGVWAADWADVVEANDELDDAALTHPVIATEGGAPKAVAEQALAGASYRTAHPPAAIDLSAPDDAGQAILFGGAPVVGKSTIAWQAFLATRAVTRTAFLDIRQLGFVGRDGGEPDHTVQALVAGALWDLFRARGARLLILNGTVESPSDVGLYAARLRATPLAAVRLVADRDALMARATERTGGTGPSLAGDTLRGASADAIERAVAETLARQEDVAGDPAFPTFDTNGRTAQDSALLVLRQHVLRLALDS